MKRNIVKIDEDLCNGCSLCIPNCQEGALQIIDGKVRLISDLFCDGLGACLGHCPEGAISIEEREAEPYDERKVMEIISKQGENTIIAHLKHLKEHGETEYYAQGVEYLKENNININLNKESKMENHSHCNCPGSEEKSFNTKPESNDDSQMGSQKSELRQWPVQMHLVNPMAPYFKESDLLLAADCVPFSMGNFHSTHLKGRSLAIACPKLDANQDVYINKLVAMIDEAKINTITVMIMEVPCCGGLLRTAQMAQEKATRKVPIKSVVISLQGEVIQESWM